ncbi:endonuclease/exonuclease/phosphatase family protein [Rhabdobacter roseus]|uniref:Endonuclease/exonuclease/phosphatase family metal-dependent hydrolase n=1 Tax=Rhabdobacter roseus TaxID=1655419 RepID=A0A840TX09_9BACT|nr:endonuclease/exonuclease/phosphatase family protein [Rhabdobacter roseus]MBB5286142.1 endonuclease/exonuclease/phosphatase family metal-dependent hydrolase [Rhabdobacter roseus]
MYLLKNTITALILVGTLLACGPKGTPSTRPGQEISLRVMTYNVFHCSPPSTNGKIEVETTAAVINREKPDLVALQEIDVHNERSGKELHQARELARLTGMYYYFSKGIDYRGGDYGVAVLSKYPIVDSVRYALPIDPAIGGEPRTIAVVTVQLPGGRKVLFGSTHLDLKEQNRLSQARIIVERFKDAPYPMILGGDFNAQPGSAVINYLDEHFVRSCQQDCQATIPVRNPNRTIDFIMVKPADRFQVVSTRVIDEQYASDHLPVVADLKLTK